MNEPMSMRISKWSLIFTNFPIHGTSDFDVWNVLVTLKQCPQQYRKHLHHKLLLGLIDLAVLDF